MHCRKVRNILLILKFPAKLCKRELEVEFVVVNKPTIKVNDDIIFPLIFLLIFQISHLLVNTSLETIRERLDAPN